MDNPLDRLLGPGVVIVTADGCLALDDSALGALRHRARPPPGERCFCPACRFLAEHDPAPAPASARQPWQPKKPRDAGDFTGLRPAA